MSLRFLLWAAAILLAGFLLIGLCYCGYQEFMELPENPDVHQASMDREFPLPIDSRRSHSAGFPRSSSTPGYQISRLGSTGKRR